jgi:hypothetical protein
MPCDPVRVRAALLAVNRPDAPYAIREAARAEAVDLVAEWRIGDVEWRALFANGGVTKTCKVLMRLDPASSEVRTIDLECPVTWNAGVPEVSASRVGGTGQFNEDVHASLCTVDERGRWTKLHGYRFRTQDIKEPLREATTRSGWVWHALMFSRP